MKSKRLLLMLLIALIAPWAANAQNLSDYTLTVGSETYTSIADADLLLASVNGDGGSQTVTLPFDFPFGENYYTAGTTLTVRADGYVYFGSSSPGHSSKSAWTNTTSEFYLIAPFLNYDGKISANGATSGAYCTTDDPDNPTVLIIEFKKLQCYYGDNGDYNFQIRLYPNGNISTVYGESTLCTYSSASQNFFLNAKADKICLTGSYAEPVAGTPSSLPNFTTAPAAGQVITYVRPVFTCFKPQNLAATLTPGDGSIATLTWERNAQGTENAWVLEYGTAADFTGATSVPVTGGTPSKDLTGLTPETTYYARVKPDCDTDGSLWSATCTFTPTDAYTITVNDGTNTNSNVPITGSYCDYGNRSQFIIPATDLTSLQWASLDKLTFYANAAVTSTFSGTVFEVYLAEVSNTVFESQAFVDWTTLDKVYDGSLVYNGKEWVFDIDDSYTYSGGNLLIGFYETSYTSNYTSISWLGKNQATGVYTALYQTASSNHAYSGNPNRSNFLPKLTIEYTPGEAPACLPATDLTANDVTAHTASLSWTANNGESTWKLYWKKTSDANYTEVPASDVTNPYPLSGLDGETQYTFYVVADCGDGGESDPSLECSFTTLVACPIPTTLTWVGSTTTSATLSWTENGSATAWQICLNGNEDDPIDVDASELVEGQYTLQGLTPATNYTVKVRANCGGIDGTSEWSNQVSFVTECEAIDLANVDFSENFDGITLASAYTPSTQTLPVCWSSINTTTYSSYKVYPTMYYYSYTDYSHSSPNSLRFYSSYSSYSNYDPQNQYAILPEMENLAGKQITLWIRGYNATTPFKVGLITNPADASTFVEITNDANPSLSTGYQEFNYIIPSDATANYVAIMMEAANSSNNTRGLYIDDIKIADPPTCLRPENLAFVSSTTTEATLSWTNGAEGQTAWQIVYSTNPNFDPDDVTLTPVDVTTNSGTIDGLTASTTYYAYVRANCGNDGYSDWSTAYVQFATACEAITDFPVSYNFETSEGFPANASTPTTNLLGACWRNEATLQTGTNSTRVWGTSTSYKHEGSQALILPDKGNSSNPAKTMLVFPEMVFTSERGYTVSFWIYRSATSTNPEGFKVYISDTDTISDNAVELGHYSRNYGIAYPVIESAAGWYQYEIQIPQSTMTGNVFLIFEGQSYYGNATYVDEVLVKETPTCQTPSGLAFVSSTTTSATLGWTAVGTETAWQIAYSTDPAFNPDEVTPTNVTSNPGTISGLTASTIYYAYVRANCGNNDYSDWNSAYVQFATECDVVVVDAAHPYTQDFSTWTPICWELGEAVDNHNWTLSAGSAYSGYYGTIDLYMPAMYIDANNAVLQFQSRESSPTYYTGGTSGNHDGLNIVKLSTDNGLGWVQLWCPTIDELTTSFRTVTISLEDYVGQDIIIAFEYQGTDAHGWSVDDVKVIVPFTKHIAAHTATGGWYMIASPLATDINPEDVDGMTTNNFDLYQFNQAVDMEWENWKASGDHYHFDLTNGRGYLYANSEDVDLIFIGTPYSGNGEVTLHKSEGVEFPGMNLVGNPFPVTAYIDRDYYTMNDGATALIPVDSQGPHSIEAMEGIFVEADYEGDILTFTPEGSAGNGKGLVLNLSQGRGVVDRAIVRFGEGHTLHKFTLSGNSTKMYIPQEGEDFAVVRSRNSGEVPVSFEPAEDGIYSISVDVRNLIVRSLILTDKVERIDIDLLRTPSYQFKAATTDPADRFVLSYKTGTNQFKELFMAGEKSADFGFFNNGSWMIDNEGEATLQVIDVNGRVLSSETINGNASIHVDAAPGVYMLRLINGDSVKVQKVVVE